MRKSDELRKLASSFSDAARKVQVVGPDAYIPLKFDSDGEPISAQNFDAAKHIKRLNLVHLRFLNAWKSSGWDTEKACNETGTDPESAKRLIRKLQVFKDEEERVKALANIPTPPWIAAKHTQNVLDGSLDDSQRDSLKELSKIVGAYKPTTNINVNAAVFQMPQMTPEQAKAAKEFFDTIATQPEIPSA